jgi:hypothetical protein
VRPLKRGHNAFSPGILRENTTRASSNVTHITALVADIDDGISLDELKTTIAQFSWIAYSSHSHDPGSAKFKFRLIFFIGRVCSVDEWKDIWAGMNKLLRGHCDQACKDPARLYFLPSCPEERSSDAFVVSNDGDLIDLDYLKGQALEPQGSNMAVTNALCVTMPEQPQPETPANIERVKSAAAAIDSDSPRDVWRDVVWAIKSLGWGCGKQLATDWSMRGFKWDAVEFEMVWNSGKRDGGITIGTLFHHAPGAGWLSNVGDGALEAVQQRFALITLKKVGVIERQALAVRKADGIAEELTIFNRADGTLLIQRFVEERFPQDQGNRAKQFMTHPSTVCYEGVEFNPRETTPRYLNLWVPPTVAPQQGDWSVIQEFILLVICDGVQASFDYLIRYIAHGLQRPWEKPGVMIAMLGGEGIGKGTLARILRRIWTATFLHTHTMKNIVGDFNESLERVFWVFLDEAIFAGDHAGANALKGLITEPTIHINPKGQPPRQLASYHRFVAATNAEHFKQVDPDNRRDFMLRVSEKRKGDENYWRSVSAAIDGVEVAAMVFDLLAMDLSDYNPRNRPQTRELTRQKIHSLGSFARWWHDCLNRGAIDAYRADWPDFVSTLALTDAIKESTKGIRQFKQVTEAEIGTELKKVCSGVSRDQKKEGNNRRRGFNLPPLPTARAMFEKYIGDTVEWDEA